MGPLPEQQEGIYAYLLEVTNLEAFARRVTPMAKCSNETPGSGWLHKTARIRDHESKSNPTNTHN